MVRWEFKNPQPFLRTREFLWQEGHSAFPTLEDAKVEVLQILDLYRRVYEELLALPVVPGRKTEKEKFAGGLYTTTVEGFVPASGRGIQGATSHGLGQSFAKMFDISFENEAGERQQVWQNSWGITTRTIGVMVMVHGDDKGLVLPPRVASVQVIVIPVGITAKSSAEAREKLMGASRKLVDELRAVGIRCDEDTRVDKATGFKFNDWELKGVPLRLEIGPRDLDAQQVVLARRDTGEKLTVPMEGLGAATSALLERIQGDMFARAKKERDERLVQIAAWSEFQPKLDGKNMILAPFCERVECEENIKRDTSNVENPDPTAPAMGAKSLCIPFDQPALAEGTKCVHPDCTEKAKSFTLFGRSY